LCLSTALLHLQPSHSFRESEWSSLINHPSWLPGNQVGRNTCQGSRLGEGDGRCPQVDGIPVLGLGPTVR
jgi:hypothetical protein